MRELKEIIKRLDDEKSLNYILKKEQRRLKEEISELDDQICNYETKRVKTSAELRATKERLTMLEEEILVEEQQKVAFLSRKLLHEQEKNRELGEMNNIYKNNLTQVHIDKDLIHNDLLDTLDTKEELQDKIFKLSDKSDILVNSCKDMELTVEGLQNEKEQMLSDFKIDKQHFQKEYDNKISHYEKMIQSKNNEIQTMQKISNEQMEQHAIDKKLNDDMIKEMECFMNNINKRLEITSDNAVSMADEHSTMSRKLGGFCSRSRKYDHHNPDTSNASLASPNKNHLFVAKQSPLPSSAVQKEHQQDNENALLECDNNNLAMTNSSDSDETAELHSS